jgi:hypothetical protein
MVRQVDGVHKHNFDLSNQFVSYLILGEAKKQKLAVSPAFAWSGSVGIDHLNFVARWACRRSRLKMDRYFALPN